MTGKVVQVDLLFRKSTKYGTKKSTKSKTVGSKKDWLAGGGY